MDIMSDMSVDPRSNSIYLDALTTFVRSEFNVKDHCDVEVRIFGDNDNNNMEVEESPSEHIATYYLHTFILNRCDYFSAMLSNSREWRESRERRIEVKLNTFGGWIKESDLRSFFESLYSVVIQNPVKDGTLKFIMHYLCTFFGFELGIVTWGQLILDGISIDTMVETYEYVTRSGTFPNMTIEDRCLRMMKGFNTDIAVGINTICEVLPFDTFISFIKAKDFVGSISNKLTFVQTYLSMHRSTLMSEEVCSMTKIAEELRKESISYEGNKYARCIGLLHLPCKSENSQVIKKDVAGFELGDCKWKIFYTSDPKNKKGHFGVVVDSEFPRRNRSKSVCFDAHMYILGRTKTHEVFSNNVNVETGGCKINFATIKLTSRDLGNDFFEKSYRKNEIKKEGSVSIPLVMYIEVISVNGISRKRNPSEL